MCETKATQTKGDTCTISGGVEGVGGVGKKGEYPEGNGCGGVAGVEKKEVDVGG